MPTIVNVQFKVIRVDYAGNPREPYSRLFFLEGVNLDRSFSSTLDYRLENYITFIYDIKKAFPELRKNEGTVNHSIKLLFSGSLNFSTLLVLKIHPDLIEFYILYLDGAGDKILVESKEDLPPNCRDYEATRDLFTIIQMNKSKCLAGEPIPLYIMDLSPKNSPNVGSPTDSTVNILFSKHTLQKVPILL